MSKGPSLKGKHTFVLGTQIFSEGNVLSSPIFSSNELAVYPPYERYMKSFSYVSNDNINILRTRATEIDPNARNKKAPCVVYFYN